MKYMLKKITTLIITLLLVSVVTFVAFSVIPGDPALAKLGTYATPERVEALREEMGLNKSLPERYIDWLQGAVHGDFGESYQYAGVPVSELINQRLQVTAILAVMSFIIILVIAIPMGIVSARKEGTWIDVFINLFTQVTMAIPAFFLEIWHTTVQSVKKPGHPKASIRDLVPAAVHLNQDSSYWLPPIQRY